MVQSPIAKLMSLCRTVSWASTIDKLLTNVSLTCLQGPLQQLPISREHNNRNFLSGFCVTCEDVVSCISDSLSESDKSSFGSSQVILGIAPTLLSLVAPTIGELLLLSTSRPFLSFLIGLGAPPTFSSRLLTFEDPLDSLLPVRTFFTQTPIRRNGGASSLWAKSAISLCEYLIMFGAVGNIVEASWRLGQQTILSWQCDTSIFPLTWIFMASIIPMIVSQSWLFSRTMRAVRAGEKRSGKSETRPAVWRWIVDEVTPSALREKKRGFLKHRGTQESRWIIFANIIAQLMSLVLALYGTFILSSLLLISVRNSFYVFLRFFFGAGVCRLVLMFELSGMAAVESEYDMEESQGQQLEPMIDAGTKSFRGRITHRV